MSMPAQPTQLRLGFTRPQIPMEWFLDISGLFIFVTPASPATDADVTSALADLGVPCEIRQHLGVCVPVAQMRLLGSLRQDIKVTPSPDLEPLWYLVTHPPIQSLPATLTVVSFNTFHLEWDHMGSPEEVYLNSSQVVALLASEVAFVATQDAWERIDAVTRASTITGKVTANLDGYLEIVSSRPQLVEAMGLPGLFRIDPTHFGLPLGARDALLESPGGLLVGQLPPAETPSEISTTLELSSHHLADLASLVSSLSAYGSRVICWESGLGRRIFALAALDSLDAWPALIVTTPSQLWAWQRHLDLVGRSYSVNHSDADVHLVTYHDIIRRRFVPSVPALIFDQLSSREAVAAHQSLRRLAGLKGAIRIDIESEWPDSPEDQCAILEILRPGEFTSEVSIAERYPPDSYARFAEHASYYISVRRYADTDTDPHPFRRSSVHTVSLSETHQVAFDDAAARLVGAPASQALFELLEIITAGPPNEISPKVVAAARLARYEAESGRSCAVVTRSHKAVTLLRSLLRPVRTDVVTPGSSPTRIAPGVTLVRFEHEWPNLKEFDHVIILDYPWSLAVIDQAVGPSTGDGPDQVTVIHATDSLDDRMAILASRRRELASVTRDNDPPTIDEIIYLVEPRAI